MARGAIILIEDGRVALIRRERGEEPPYYLFPGGGVEEGETPEDAAVREALEELGLRVALEGLLAIVEFKGRSQHYFWARRRAGVFGTGQGTELADPRNSRTGSHSPVWLPLDEIQRSPVRPRALAALVATGQHPRHLVRIVDAV